MSLLVVISVFYGWFGVVLFYDTPQGRRDFPNLIDAIWTLWICITTANYPDVMMPSYNENRLAALYFVSFMIISFFFIMNLVLASVVNAYDGAIEDRKKWRAKLATRNLTQAFHLLDHKNTGRIDRDTIMALFLILNEDFPEFRKMSEEETKLLFGFLDRDGSSLISLEEFQDFGEILLLEFTKASDYATLVETRFPKLFQWPVYQKVCDTVRSPTFEFVVDGALILNAVVIAIQTYPQLAGRSVEVDPHVEDGYIDTYWEFFETLFTILYLIEVLLKIMVLGWKRYSESPRHMFDFLVTVSAVAATAYVYYPNDYSDSRLIRFIVMARVLRLMRLVFAMNQFQLVGIIVVEIFPGAINVFMLLFFVMYIFAALGMTLYGGMITRDPSNPLSDLVLNSDFSDNSYWANNFNDMMSGMNVLFNLLVINNWTECEIGFEAVTEGKWVRYFFFSFHILGVILANNLVVAFIINGFFQQLSTVTKRSIGKAEVEGGAVIQGERAKFDGSQVTGTKTGATGEYIARLRSVYSDVEVDEQERLKRLFTQTSSSSLG
jgi:two pore calcium channel protein, plant